MKKLLLLFILSFIATATFAQFSGGGNGTAENPYKLSTATDVDALHSFIGQDFANTHFELINDINISGNRSPIGDANNNSFYATVNGNGYKITGLYIRGGNEYSGLFGYLKNSTIKNLQVEGSISSLANSNTDFCAGVLSGYADGCTIENCYVFGEVSAKSETESSYVGTVCEAYSGGLIGYCKNTRISNCKVTLKSIISSAKSYATYSSLYSSSYSGGLIGYSDGVEVTNCKVDVADISSSSVNKGVEYPSYEYSGGIVGYAASNTKISNSYSYIKPSRISANTGGLVGYINGSTNALVNSFSYGSLQSGGGVVGTNKGAKISRCYFNTDRCWGGAVVSGTTIGLSAARGINTAMMKMKAMFIDWDFNNVWAIIEGQTFPYLQNNPPEGYIGGRVDVCQNIEETYFFTKDKSDYDWEVTGGEIVSGQGTHSVVVRWGEAGTGSVNLYYLGGSASYPVTVNISAPVAKTNVSVIGELQPAISSTQTYTTESGKNNYVWNITGGEVVSGQGTNTVSVQWGCGIENSVNLSYQSTDVCSSVIDTNIKINLTGARPTISGNLNPEPGSTLTYNTEASKGSYNWAVVGGSIQSGTNTRQATVKWDCNAASRQLSVSYKNTSDCQMTTDKVVVAQSINPTITGAMRTYGTKTYITETGKSSYNWTVSSGGTIQSGQGTNQVTVKWNEVASEAEEHITVTYANSYGCSAAEATDSTVTIVRTPSDDNSLHTLTVSAGTLAPAFNASITSYQVAVANEVSSITIDATVNQYANIAGLGEHQLVVGNNNITVTVTAENGTTKTYTINVVRAGSNDASLALLTVNKGTLTPSFNSDVFDYEVELASSENSITITAVKNHAGASVSGDGSKVVNLGLNTFTVTVTAENGTTQKKYIVKVTRIASADATLDNLTVSSGVLLPTFNPDITDYFVALPYSVSSITVGATKHDNASNVFGTGLLGLQAGVNSLDVVVIAENSSTLTYNIKAVRVVDDVLLDSIASLKAANIELVSDTVRLYGLVGELLLANRELVQDTIRLYEQVDLLVEQNVLLLSDNYELVQDSLRLYGKVEELLLANNKLAQDTVRLYIEVLSLEYDVRQLQDSVDLLKRLLKECEDGLSSSSEDKQYMPTDIKVYPNPVGNEVLQIQNCNGESVRMYDFSGKLLHSAADCEKINMQAYPAGIYLLQIGNFVAKVVKR